METPMKVMKLNRLPNEKELDKSSVEAHSFLDSFNKKAVTPFEAEVKDNGDGHVQLGDWDIAPADWFKVVDKD